MQFEIEVDGKKSTELHTDGGITAQLFVPSHVFAAAAQGAAEDARKPGVNPPAKPAAGTNPSGRTIKGGVVVIEVSNGKSAQPETKPSTTPTLPVPTIRPTRPRR